MTCCHTSNQKLLKIAVSGAAGSVAYAFLFRLASGAVFGCDVALDIRLLEIDAALSQLQGTIMELEDCAFPLLKSVSASSDPNMAFDGADWAILIGSMARQAGMQRSDLLGKNAAIFAEQGKAINLRASDSIRVFVVGNPCNTNCWVAKHFAPDVDSSRFFAMSALDENRARFQLAKKSGCALQDVKRMVVWGNHSSTQYADFYNARIDDQPVTDYIDESWLQSTFLSTVQQRGTAVIAARGASSAASAAQGVVDSLVHLSRSTTPKDDAFSLSLCSQGSYGIDPGLIFSFPCRATQAGVIEVVEHIPHNEWAQARIMQTAEELRTEREMALRFFS